MRVVTYSRSASKSLARLPVSTAAMIRSKMSQYAADPASLANNIKRLRERKGLLRLRIGDWRVLFTDDGRVVLVEKVAPRGSAYD